MKWVSSVVIILLLWWSHTCVAVEVWDHWIPIDSPRLVLALSNEIWTVCDGAVVRWDKATGSYQKWTRLDGGPPDAPPDAHWVSIAGRDGYGIWLAARGMTAHFDGQQWRAFPLPEEYGSGGLMCEEKMKLGVGPAGVPWLLSDVTSQGLGRSALARFEADSWREVLRLPCNWNDMAVDSRGAVWFSPCDLPGLCRYDERGLVFCACPFFVENADFSWLCVDGEDTVFALGHWDFVEYGLVKFDGKTWQMFEIWDGVLCDPWLKTGICVDPSGAVWWGSDDFGLSKWTEQGGVEQFGLSSEDLARSAVSLSVDPGDGSIWVASLRRGLHRFDGECFERWAANEEVSHPIRCGWSGPDGVLWLGTAYTSQLGKYVSGSRIEWVWSEQLPKPSGFFSAGVSEIKTDPQGRPWLGTLGLGLVCVDGHSAILYNSWNTNIPRDSLDHLAFDQRGSIWVGCAQTFSPYVARFDGQRFHEVDYHTVGVWEVHDIEPGPLAAMWFCGGRLSLFDEELPGLSRRDDDGWVQYGLGESGLSIAFDGDGVLWLGTDTGFRTFDGRDWHFFTKESSGYPFHCTYLVRIDGLGRKWFAGPPDANDGVCMFDDVNWRVYNTENSPLISNAIWDIFFGPDNSIWFATKAGLSRMREFAGEVQLRLQPEHSKGPVLRLLLSCSNQIADLNADLFFWAELADGTRVYLPRVSTQEHPIFTRLAIPDGFAVENVSIYSVDLTDIPRGHYVIKALLTNHGCRLATLKRGGGGV